MKNNIGFYTTEVEVLDERRHLLLRAYYGGEKGWAMESRFYGLKCLIGKAENCRLDVAEKGEKARIARALELSLADLEEFLHVLIAEAELLHEEGGVVWTQETDEDLQRAMSVRQEAANRRNGHNSASSADNHKMSADKSKMSADKNHGAEQSRAERSRVEKSNKQEGKTEEARSPALIDSLREELGKVGLAFPEEDLQRLALRCVSRGLDEGFVAYAMARAESTPKTKNAKGLAKKGLMEYEDWATEYKTAGPKPKTDALVFAPPPPSCDCLDRGEIHYGAYEGEGICKVCGASWRYDRTWEIWKKATDEKT